MWMPSCSSPVMQESLLPFLQDVAVDDEQQHPPFLFPDFDDLLVTGLGDDTFAVSDYDNLLWGWNFEELSMQEDPYGVAPGMEPFQHEDLMQSAADGSGGGGGGGGGHLLPAPAPQEDQELYFVVPPPAPAAAAAGKEEESLQKSLSFGSLNSAADACGEMKMDMEAAFGANSMAMRTYSEGDIQLFDVPEMSLEAAAFAMRSTYSEGDVQGVGVGNTNFGHGCFELLSALEDAKLEERSRKLSRYRKKRTQRNFGRKIKYACRKALADSQPRIRGRFAKMKDSHHHDEGLQN